MEVGDGGRRLCNYRYTVTTRMTSALRTSAMRAVLMFHNCEGRSHKTVSTDHNVWWERRAEADSNRSPSAYQPNALNAMWNRLTSRKRTYIRIYDDAFYLLTGRNGGLLIFLKLRVFSWWDVCIFKMVALNAWFCVYFRMVTLNCLMLCIFSGRSHWPAWHCVHFLNGHTQCLRLCIFRMVTLNCWTLCIFSMVRLTSLLLCVFSGWSHWISWRCEYFQDGHTDLLNIVCIF